MEIWKKIKGIPFDYYISNHGRLKSNNGITRLNYNNVYINKTIFDFDRNDSYRKKEYSLIIHREVARAFLPPPDPIRTQVNHKDGNKHNNNVDNLEWCTPGENVRHAFETGLMDDRVYLKNEIDIRFITKLVHSGFNIIEIARLLKVSTSFLCQIVYHQTNHKTCKEFYKAVNNNNTI